MEPKEKFKLVKLLGMGGFGQTFLAEVIDPKLRSEWGAQVALKIPHNRQKEQVLINELITNAMLHHLLQGITGANLVRYYGFDKYQDQYVMALEYVEGQPLRRIIEDEKVLTPARAVAIAKQVSLGLACMHEQHYFHRDIKPDNIMVCSDGTIKIMDLGLSKALGDAELAKTSDGTIVYMAKEVITGQGGSFYSDIYSLGVTLYEMVTGTCPFVGNSVQQVIDNICVTKAIPASEVNQDVDQRLNAIILRSLSHDVSYRYANGRAFYRVLDLYEKGEDESDEEIDQTTAQARELLNIGKTRDAEALLQKKLAEHPEKAKLYACLGELMNKCQRPREAITVFEKGLKVAPGYAILYWNNAFSYKQLGNNDKAIENMRKAVACGLDNILEVQAATILNLWEQR